MLGDITLGQYIPVDSPVHRLDPRAKLLLTILFIVCVFMVHTLWGYIPITLFLVITTLVAKIPPNMLFKGLKPLRLILILTFLLNLFLTQTGNTIFQLAFVRITDDGLNRSLHYSLRLMFLVLGTSLLTYTTSPVALSDGIELLLSPLRKLHFPVHELAMMMTIALRFIPTLMEETDKIMKAQMARGADFETGNLLARAKAMVPLLVPLFVSAFRRAGDLAMAMEARCYHGGENRTRIRVLKLTVQDGQAALCTLCLLGVIILEGVLLK